VFYVANCPNCHNQGGLQSERMKAQAARPERLSRKEDIEAGFNLFQQEK
jgi:hypothetical protein